MLKRRTLLALVVAPFFILLNFVPATALTAAECANLPPTATTADAIKCGTNDAAGVPQDSTTNPATRINTTVDNVINLLSIAVGIAAVIMLILGGFRYVTSSGNQETVKAAKNTITYALIGLVIVALAQLIVNFVLNKATQP